MATHQVIDFLTSNNVLVSPDIQSRPVHPFTMQHAQRFFGNFAKESFTFSGAVRAILIRDGKENSVHMNFKPLRFSRVPLAL